LTSPVGLGVSTKGKARIYHPWRKSDRKPHQLIRGLKPFTFGESTDWPPLGADFNNYRKITMGKEFELNLVAGKVKAAMAEGDASKSDMYWAPLASLRIIPGFNVRTPGPDYDAHVAHTGSLILANGFDRACPLKTYISNEDGANVINVYDGHTRYLGTLWANERGAAIERLPIITAPAGTTMEDLLFAMGNSAESKHLAPYERGVLCKRLLGMGVDEDVIASRFGITRAYLDDLLMLQGAPKKIRDMVMAGGVSATTAVDTLKAHGSKAADLLGGKLEVAKAAGKTRVTKKDIAPKRNLLDDGIDWIKSEGAWQVLPDQKLVGLLAHVTGTPADAITTRLNAG
jgi:ParB family transcriptional regulator, chromosome partitioning protein